MKEPTFLGQRVVAATFVRHGPERRLTPFHLTLRSSNGRRDEYFDVAYCKRDDTLFYSETGSGPATNPVFAEGGGGGEGDVTWVAPGMAARNGAGQDLELLMGEWPGVDLDDLVQGDTVWCNECGDRLPEDDLCGHVAECDECHCFDCDCRHLAKAGS